MAMLQFNDRIAGDPVDDIDWIMVDPSANPTDACRIYLELDCANGSVEVDCESASLNATPEAVWNQRRIRWYLMTNVDAVDAWADITGGRIAEALAGICDGYTEERDDRLNRVGRYTLEAQDLMDRITRWLFDLRLIDEGGLIDAGDWFEQGAPDGLTAATTDDELPAMAETLERHARLNGWIVVGLEERLRWLRDGLRAGD